jgi:hypothetical protein
MAEKRLRTESPRRWECDGEEKISHQRRGWLEGNSLPFGSVSPPYAENEPRFGARMV